MQIPKNTKYLLECIAVCFTGVGKVFFINILDYRLIFIIASCSFWFSYIFYRIYAERKKKSFNSTEHNDKKSFQQTFKELLPYAIGLVLCFVCYGNFTGKSVTDHSILFILILYPIWGILQQYLVLGIFGDNLKRLSNGKLSDTVVVMLTACLFAIVHYPHPALIASTFFLAIVYMSLYLRGHSILAMGVFHGWLAAFFFYYALGRNPWLEAIS